MIEINLLPDVKQELIKAQRIRSQVITVAIIVGIVSLSVVTALALYVYTVQAVRSGILDRDIKASNAKLVKVKDLSKMLTIQNQLTKISDLNKNKDIDSRIFDLLNAIIPPAPNDIKISDLTINSSLNTIIINGQAQNSYAAAEVFKKTIDGAKFKYTNTDGEKVEKALASDINTSDTSYGEDSSGLKVLRFTIKFTYDQDLFSPESKKVSIIITNKGNATDSYLGLPKSIFADRAKDIKEDK